jgi:predicted ATP-dependent serine protease
VEGSRPILVEVQALVSTSTFGNARRMAVGIDQNRLSLLLAVLEKRAGLALAASPPASGTGDSRRPPRCSGRWG